MFMQCDVEIQTPDGLVTNARASTTIDDSFQRQIVIPKDYPVILNPLQLKGVGTARGWESMSLLPVRGWLAQGRHGVYEAPNTTNK